MENKIQLFEGVKVRYAWDAESEEWMFSAADVCHVLAESASKDPTAYWRKLKQRLLKEGSEVVTNCHELKMKARQPETFSQSRNIAKEGGSVAKNAREDIESRLGHSILSESNASDKKALDIKPELAVAE